MFMTLREEGKVNAPTSRRGVLEEGKEGNALRREAEAHEHDADTAVEVDVAEGRDREDEVEGRAAVAYRRGKAGRLGTGGVKVALQASRGVSHAAMRDGYRRD